MITIRFFILLSFIWIWSCKNEKRQVDVSKIDIRFNTERFDRDFFLVGPTRLSELKQKYPYLFPEQYADSIWIQKMNRKESKLLFDKAQAVFSDFKKEKTALKSLFQHVKYYYPTWEAPEVVTLISDLDYQNKIIYTGAKLLISLDTYLGKNDSIYNTFPAYLRSAFDRRQLMPEVALQIAKKMVPKTKNRSFLARIIYYGKRYYMAKLFLPQYEDCDILDYTPEQLQWCHANEKNIWGYFLTNNLLYSTDIKLSARFIDPAPFSKFYLGLDNQSPGRVGLWLGFRIVTSFMDNNDVSLQKMLDENALELLKKSKYKPQK